MSAEYEVLAVRYGQLVSTRSSEFYRYGVYDEPDAELTMDYFFWVVRNDEATILVDTGYHPSKILDRPGRVCLTPPMEALETLRIDPESVSQVVVTHFHFDHIGNVSSFPNATIVLQQHELDFWTGPHGHGLAAAASVEASEVGYLRESVDGGRVRVLDGDAEIAPGVRAKLVGGHCPGQQIVLVHDESPVVLASDALHFYEEMERDMPYEVFFDLAGVYQTYETLRSLQYDQGATIVAGHDPVVMERFPALPGSPSGLSVVVS